MIRQARPSPEFRPAAAWLGLALLTPLSLGGCTWVDLTREGEQVRHAQATEVIDCERIGTATGRTTDKVIVPRNRDKVADELLMLGRNEAARLGGNTVVEQGPPEHGAQVFDVYRCPTP